VHSPISRSPEEPTLLEHELLGRVMQYGPQLGSHVGRFKLQDVVARGGAGTIFKGLEGGTHNPVAVKVMFMPTGSKPEVMERFEREARALQTLDNPHIVSLIDFGVMKDTGSPYLVLEWIEGSRLGRHIKEHGPLTLSETWGITQQLLLALTDVHDAGFVHRDVSPNNVMLTERDGRQHVMLIDFGLVKPRPGHHSSVTRPGVIVGTPSVMAPEQFEPPRVDERVDIYAVGALLSFMLTGRNPLAGASLAEASRRLRHERARRPSEDVALHPLVDAVVTRCLERNPDSRFPSAAHLSAELEHAVKAAQSSSLKTRSKTVVAMCLRSRARTAETEAAFDELERVMAQESVGWVTRLDDAAIAMVDAPLDGELAQAVLAQATAMMERLVLKEPQLVLTLHTDRVMVRLDNLKVMGGPVLEMLHWPLPDEGCVFVSKDYAAVLPMLEGRPRYGELNRVV
jgi:hypothetical protein